MVQLHIECVVVRCIDAVTILCVLVALFSRKLGIYRFFFNVPRKVSKSFNEIQSINPSSNCTISVDYILRF